MAILLCAAARYGDADVAAAHVWHPEHSYPDSPKAGGGGLSKEQQEEQIRAINRRASRGSSADAEGVDGPGQRVRRGSSTSSQRYDDADVAAAQVKHPEHRCNACFLIAMQCVTTAF